MARNPTELEIAIRKAREKKDILLMTHIVLGYPNFDDSLLELLKTWSRQVSI